MTKVLHIPEGQPLNEWFLDELQEYLATFASPNFLVTIQSNTVLQVVAGAGNDQVAIGINDPAGSPSGYAFRFNTATVTASAPGGLIVGDNDVFVTSYVAGPFSSNPSPPPRQIDAAPALTFGLAVLAPGSTPTGSTAVAWYRKVAKATWDGAKFTKVTMLVGGGGTPAVHASSHLPSGTDPLAWLASIHMIGLASARPTAATGNAGLTYFATDTSGGTLYESTGSAWQQLGVGLTAALPPAAHAATHLTGGTDALAWESTIHGRGTTAARPAYAASQAGYLYFATDTGILFRASVAAGAWEQIAAAVSHAANHLGGGTDAIAWGTVNSQGLASARPAAAAANTGYFYFATDTNGGTLYRSTGSAWTQVSFGLTSAATPIAHAASHAAAGTDALAWTTIHGKGTTAARPTAAAGNAGYTYFATDTGGGTLYQSDGAAWAQIGIGLTSGPAPGAHEATHLPTGTDALPWLSQIHAQGTAASRPAAASGNAGLTYLATDTNGGTLYYSTGSAWTAAGAGVSQAASAHAATHLGGASDAISWGTVISQGTFASRPAAAAANTGYIYIATDTNGGTSYRSTGAAWTQMGQAVSPAASAPQAHASTHLANASDAINWASVHSSGTQAARPGAAAGNAGYIYFATDIGVIYRSTGGTWEVGNASAAAFSQTPIAYFAGGTTGYGNSTYTVSAPAAGTYIVEWGAADLNTAGQGSAGTIACSLAGTATVRYADVSDTGGTGFTVATLTNGQVVTFTTSISGNATSMTGVWAKLTRIA